MNPIDRLTEYFTSFPGIGPRQAKRFVYFLLTRDKENLDYLAESISALKSHIRSCAKCFRFFPARNNNQSELCSICGNENRDHNLLMIVPRDSDLDQIERAKAWNGLYFVLGGTVPILEKAPEARIRIVTLKKRIADDMKNGLSEIILATNVNPEGEHTMEYVEAELKPIIEGSNIKITHLGRGFSTGTEIEYSDSETIKNALKNRF